MSDDKNPWGNRGKKPTDLDEIIQQGLKKLFGDKRGKKSPTGDDKGSKPVKSTSLGFIIAILVVLFLGYQSVYQIQPNEQGVILRFGRFFNITGPGLHFLIPFVEKAVKVDVESIRTEEFGFRQNISRGFSQSSSNTLDLESLMITADKNVIQLNWVVQYKIRDPEHFLFNIRNPRAAVRDVSESVIRRLAGNRYFDYVLNNREEMAESSMKEMQELLDKYNSGIQLIVVQLQDLNPPDPVRPSFNEVNEAEQDKIRLGNEAQKEANKRIPRALGTAQKMIQEAEGYAIERVNKSKGDVARFNAIYGKYRKAKTVTRTRMYVEALKETLPNIKDVIIIDPGKNSMIPLINLGDAFSPLSGKTRGTSGTQ